MKNVAKNFIYVMWNAWFFKIAINLCTLFFILLYNFNMYNEQFFASISSGSVIGF